MDFKRSPDPPHPTPYLVRFLTFPFDLLHSFRFHSLRTLTMSAAESSQKKGKVLLAYSGGLGQSSLTLIVGSC